MDMTEYAHRIEQLKTKLYRTAYLYVGDEATALEVVDETVYRGLKNLKQLRQVEYFETWLTRILINQAFGELRRRKRESLIETTPESSAERYDSLPLKEAILSLPPDLKAVVILRFFSDLTQAQTAETLGIPQGTVVTRQRKALELLKLDLTQEDDDES
ncbi:MAG TPA: sigma-70 family RNA polymerase sigma factor [Tissierellia bacterium]|nr:sigma-70 family RNA polymerase sigma factor [Tissierellia bacterium]